MSYMKFKQFFIIGLLIMSLISCEKEDNMGVGSMDLEAIIGLTTVELKWKRPVREVNIEVSYDLYLNDELVEAEKLNPGYIFEDLPANTNYIFKVIGDIDGEIYTDEITFSTFNTDDYTFSLKSIERTGLTFLYNENGLLERVNGSNTDIDLEYDSENRLTSQSEVGTVYGFGTTVTYGNDSFSTINSSFASDPSSNFIRNYSFSDKNNYTIRYRDDMANPTYDYTNTVTLGRNAQGQITSYELFDDSGASIDKMEFSYNNGNLVQLRDQRFNHIYDFSYDTKKSYLTFSMFRVFDVPIKIAAGIPFPSENLLYNRVFDIPELFLMRATNNLVQIKRDGEQYATYEYTYYGDLPIAYARNEEPARELLYELKQK